MFQFKTECYPFQETVFNDTKDEKSWGLWLEQGLGKTKITLDTAAYLALKGEITGMLVVAPNGVHTNWVTDEIPKHFALNKVCSYTYYTSKSKSKYHQNAVEALLRTKDFAVLVMSYDAILTKEGVIMAKKFMKSRPLLYVLDEVNRIKNPKAKTSKSIIKSGSYCPYKRALTGTPTPNGPFDIFNPIQWLDSEFWTRFRLGSFWMFKHYFAEMIKVKTNLGHEYEDVKRVKNKVTGEWEKQYRNLDELHEIQSKISTRLTKEEVLPDLPPKLFSRRYYEMNPEQRRVYKDLIQQCYSELEGKYATADLAIVLLLRLQQVICGYVPIMDLKDPMEKKTLALIGDTNPRMKLLAELCEDTPHQGIIWARFNQDIDLIMDLLGKDAVRYDGQVDDEQRVENVAKFKRGEVKWFVSKPEVGGEGLTLTMAKTVIYYNNNFNLKDRLQSEDRAHRIGTQTAVNYYDLVCQDTVDEKILGSLLSKFNISKQINGDTLKSWF